MVVQLASVALHKCCWLAVALLLAFDVGLADSRIEREQVSEQLGTGTNTVGSTRAK